jgi:hypothetical protein
MNILFSLFISLSANSSIQNAVTSDYVDFSKLNINSYLKVDGIENVIEKLEPQEKDQPIMHVIFKKEKDSAGEKVLVMQLFDFNRDGKIDLAKHFKRKLLVKSEMDLDYDGKVDVISNYDEQSGELLQKVQSDGKTNIWKYWFKGELRRKEIDRNSDKKPDMWVHYRNGTVVKTEVDVNYDGQDMRVMKQ